MGNKRSRVCRRKKRFPNLRNMNNNKISISNQTKDDPIEVVDVSSILRPTAEIKLEKNDAFDPIATITENCIESSGSDIKSYLSCNDPSANEFLNIDDTENVNSEIESNTEMQIKQKPNEIMIKNKCNLIKFENICRLCLTGKESSWIDLFSSEPYEDCDEITPSNLLEVIEQFTTIKISKDDRLPDKLCSKCFQELRHMHNFRERSLRSNKSLDSVINSLRIHHERVQHKKVLVKINQMKPIKRLTFNEAYNLDENQENVSGEVQCEVCGRVFERYKLLQYHLNKHNGVRPFVCTEPYCEKSFYSPQNRKTHFNTVHYTTPKFSCDICKKPYSTATKLKIHRTSHFPPTIPCKICGKLLRNQSSIIKHRASHSERQFKCDDCGKSFQKAYTLKVHQRIHTNEKPYVCCRCAQTFAYNCLLKTHTEKYHPN